MVHKLMNDHLDVHEILEVGKCYLASVIIATFHTAIFVRGSFFRNNTSICGGAMSVFQNSTAMISNSEFSANSATQFGGVLVVGFSNVMIQSCSFYNSSAKQGGVIKAGKSVVNILHSKFIGNKAHLTGGVLRSDQSSRLLVRNCTFIENEAYAGGVITDKTAELLTLTHSIFSRNIARGTGGVIFAVQSQIHFLGACHLSDNYARAGGALHLTKTEANIFNELTVASNVAQYTGGGIYLHHSNLNCQHRSRVTILSNNATSFNGGGIHAINSLITLYCDDSVDNNQASFIFYENMAPKGGGIYLDSYSQFYVFKSQSNFGSPNLYFVSNKAAYGEAIYVNDDTYFEICSTQPYKLSECFLQVLTPQSRTDYNLINNLTTVNFTQGDANNSLIFGGLLDRCSIDRFSEIVIEQERHIFSHSSQHINGITFLKMVSNLNDTDAILSTPIRICFCTPSNQPDCSYTPPDSYVRKGERFNVSVVAVDQVNHTIMNVTIHGYLKYTESGLGPGQATQKTRDGCTDLLFSISSPHSSEQLVLYAQGPCRNASHSQKRVHVSFLPCQCPRGFQATSMQSKCECSCDPKLEPYVDHCNSTTKLLARDSSAWIGYIEDNSSSSGYLVYPYCPLDYCLPKYPNVEINLNTANGADTQCANGRSGILCGLCKPGLSLSYGSSHCLPCSQSWYLKFVGMCVLFLFMGVTLVVTLMFLNITVAVGTINGLIFYSNIVDASGSTFSSIKFFSITTSLLNVQIGIDTCFFKGMGTFEKTWLQLAFPIYLIILVIVVIIVSHYSMRFSQLIAKKNPVATLATLILLSYTTFLRSTISILSFADLHYPDGSYRRVWLPDASIDYLRGRHVALFIVAVFILILGMAYTSILFSWQWLLRYQNKTFFCWVQSNKLRHFLEPYHAPYKFKHRYWTGLLLLVRVALYLAFAVNVSGDPKINLLVVILMVGCILFYKANLGRIYQNTAVDTIEMISYLNVCSFSAIQLFLQQEKIRYKQNVNYTAYVSGAITFILLLSVVIFHVYSVLHVWYSQKFGSKRKNWDEEFSHAIVNAPIVMQSSSEIEGRPNRDTLNSPQAMDDVGSLASSDSTTPLLDD